MNGASLQEDDLVVVHTQDWEGTGVAGCCGQLAVAVSWAPESGQHPGFGKKAACHSLNVGTKDEEGKEGGSGFSAGCLRKVGNVTFCFVLNSLLVLENSTSASQICEYVCLFLHVFLSSAFLNLLFPGRYICAHPSGPGFHSYFPSST